MNKITLIGISVAIALGFTACQKDIASAEMDGTLLVKESFSASLEQPATKTATSDGGATVTWAANDKIHYYTADGGTVRNFTVTAAGASATLSLQRETSDTYYNLVYCGSTAPTFTSKTSSSMVFDGVRIEQDGTFANANVSVARTVPEGSSMTFKPVTALVKFTTARTDIKTVILTGGLGTEKVAGNVTVDPTAATPVATLSGAGWTSVTATIATPAAGTYYINVLPGTYANGFKLTFKNAAGEILGAVNATNSIDLSAAGKMINLGNVDTHISALTTNDLSSSGNANCYIVSTAGTYKFKTVQGNSASPISSIASVSVIWESFGTSDTPTAGDLVKSVSYSSDYITFTTGARFPAKKGNALIAAKDGSGNILWSWHLWFTDAPADQVYVSSAGTMMDRNIGATSVTPGEVQTFGLLYQWGRKDPFLGADGLSSTTSAKSTGTWNAVSIHTILGDSGINTLDYSIKNPTVFISGNYGGTKHDWYCKADANRNDNLWWNEGAKTRYDPCPPGYRVPHGGETGIWYTAGFHNSTSFDTVNKGINFSSYVTPAAACWYPAAGQRTENNSLFTVGESVYCWSCTSYHTFDITSAYYLCSNSATVYAKDSEQPRSTAMSVRCVRE